MPGRRRQVAMTTALVVALLLSQTPAAQPAERKTEVIFDQDDVIDGDRTGPMVDQLLARRPPAFESLIRVRESFKDKVLHSVHEL